MVLLELDGITDRPILIHHCIHVHKVGVAGCVFVLAQYLGWFRPAMDKYK